VTRREDIGSLGFLDGDPISIADLGSLGAVLQDAVTLKDALQTFARLVPQFAEGNVVWMERDAERTWLYCHTERLDPAAFVPDDFTVRLLVELIRMAGGSDWLPLEMGFQTLASKRRRLSSELGEIEATYDRRGSAVAFPTEFLSRRIGGDSSKADLVDGDPQADPRSPADALRRVLGSMLFFNSLPTSQQAAEMIGVSRRTLTRSLESEGSSYRQLVDRVRFDGARELLENTDASIGEIAHEVGYSGANNFIRAFRRMTGTTPAEYRRSRAG